MTHKTGSRFEDSINDMLLYLGSHDTPRAGMYPPVAPVSLKPAA
ncbi:MAG: hypothetical protein ACLQKY_05205 [Terracidiphilus sp.]